MITFVITGILTEPRQNLVDLIEEAGGKVSNSVNRKTDYLVAGSDAGSKLDRARELGVEVIDEKTLRTMVRRGIRAAAPVQPPTQSRVIYRFYTESHGENEAMFDDQFNMLGCWSCNDANWRSEYFNGFLRKLGITVKPLPESQNKAAIAAICDCFGFDPEDDF